MIDNDTGLPDSAFVCSRLACVYRVMDAREKFGEHERCARVAQGVAESNTSFLSALKTSQVHT